MAVDTLCGRWPYGSDGMAAERYRALAPNASDCIEYGSCDSRCPFGVAQSQRMAYVADYFC
ncbi:MAG: hypothetical protein Q4A93_04710 [Actinomycetota bacterium]|nr:hypothetical protein [Actinomycetota bacterium]